MTFTDQSGDVAGERRWSFLGGVPESGVGPTASAMWNAPGSYVVQLMIEGSGRAPLRRVVSIGVATMPDIIGRQVSPAADELSRAGLHAGTHRDVPSLLPKGTVVAARHNGVELVKGDRVEVGWSIELDVSDGTKPVVQVSLSWEHACALTSDDLVACWGTNGSGQLGDGTTRDSNRPVIVAGLGPASAVSVGGFGDVVSCALLRDRSVACWGSNEFGQLGDGSLTDAPRPVRVRDMHDAVQVDTNGGFSCALREGGTVWCWGDGRNGGLGSGHLTGSTAPVPVGVSGASSIVVGDIGACAVLRDGGVACWGTRYGDDGFIQMPDPVRLADVEGARQVSGGISVCAVLASQTVICWGLLWTGQPDVPAVERTSPIAVPGVDGAIQISGRNINVCALRADGRIVCWGAPGAGPDAVPGLVAGISTATSVSAGAAETCAVLADQSLWCWGRRDRTTFDLTDVNYAPERLAVG